MGARPVPVAGRGRRAGDPLGGVALAAVAAPPAVAHVIVARDEGVGVDELVKEGARRGADVLHAVDGEVDAAVVGVHHVERLPELKLEAEAGEAAPPVGAHVAGHVLGGNDVEARVLGGVAGEVAGHELVGRVVLCGLWLGLLLWLGGCWGCG